MATETAIIATWLYATLSGDATLTGLATGGIFQERDSGGSTTYPKVIYRFQGGSDVPALGARRVAVNAVYAVYAVWRQASYGGALDTIAARVDTLLHGKEGTAAGGTVLACVREQPLLLANLQNGVEVRMSGGVYRIWGQR